MTPYSDDDAERNMREAIDSGDKARIDAAAYVIDQAEQAAEAVPLVAAALWYAEHGLAVFPLQPGAKIPLRGSRGCHDATTDPDQIRDWWATTPEANIGLATGGLVDVVDVDGAAGQKSRAELWETTFEQIDHDCLAKVLTPRPGGMHLYVPAVGGGNKAGIAPSVDIRGRGGYVVAPPSRTEVGTYRFLGTLDVDALEQLRKAAV